MGDDGLWTIPTPGEFQHQWVDVALVDYPLVIADRLSSDQNDESNQSSHKGCENCTGPVDLAGWLFLSAFEGMLHQFHLLSFRPLASQRVSRPKYRSLAFV